MHAAVLMRLRKLRTNPNLTGLRGVALPPDPRGDPCSFYQAMSHAEEERAAHVALDLRNAGHEHESDTVLKYLAAFGSGVGLRAIYDDLHRHCILRPAYMWRFADEALVGKIAGWLGHTVTETDRALAALAWIPGQATLELFRTFQRATPDWASLLSLQPLDYAFGAGWMLQPDGAQRRLYRERCVPLVPSQGEGIPVWRPLSEICGFCGRPLLSILGDAPPSDEVNAATCIACNDYGIMFSMEGPRRWLETSPRPFRIPGLEVEYSLPDALVKIGTERSPFLAVGYDLPVLRSQVGGLPTWVQEPYYPKCLRCHNHMDFVAQVDSMEFEEGAEGTYFVFRCAPCALAATLRQQT
jgi:hypothetical protein